MSPTQKHLLHFEGGNALSAFRAQALLPKLQSVSSRITGVAARHVHWVWTDSEAQPDAIRKLASLLRYGDEYSGPTTERQDSALVVAMPRLGTVSPCQPSLMTVTSMLTMSPSFSARSFGMPWQTWWLIDVQIDFGYGV